MPTTFTIASTNASLTAALSAGTPADGDTLYVNAHAVDYTSADISAVDWLKVELTSGFSGRFTAATGAALKLTANRTASGAFINRANAPELEITSTGPTGVIATIINQPAFGGQKVTYNDCKPTYVYHDRPSTVIFGATCDLSAATMVVTNGRVVLRQTAAAATYPIDILYVSGSGVVECSRDADEVYIQGGGVFAATGTHCSPTTVNMQGGRFDMGLCTAVTTLQGNSGVVDQRNLTTPITIGTMNLPPTVEIWRSPQTVVPTVTTDNSPSGGPKIVLFP